MKRLAKSLVAVALSAVIAGPAAAAALGTADLTIQNLLVVTQNGPINPALINIQSESRTGNASADYNGLSVASGNVTSNTPGATVDLPPSLIGPDAGSVPALYGGTLNNSPFHLSAPAGNFALADMLIQGTAVTTTPTGASGLTRAVASADDPGIGGANSTINNNVVADLVFSVTQAISAAFFVDYDVFVKAFVGPLAPGQTASASATISYVLTLRESGTAAPVLTFQPSELNQGGFSNGALTNSEFALDGSATSNFVTLNPGRVYSLTINQASNATVSQTAAVPEPSTMFLSALGLLAVGAAARRRVK